MEFDGSILFESITGMNMVKKEGKDMNIEEENNTLMTLHCEQCHTVLGDSFGICGEVECLDSIACLTLTNDVEVCSEMETARKGELSDCIFSSLECRGCHSTVGKVIHSASLHLDAVRSLFLLQKANINCYVLSSSSMVKASKLSFDMKTLRENINMVRKEIDEQVEELRGFESRLGLRNWASDSDSSMD